MRELTDHIVEGSVVNENIRITVTDEPGAGGANHAYAMDWPYSENATITEFMNVNFQNGPIKENGVNGVTHEAMLAVVIDRLRSFQSGPYSCRENSVALTKCEEALMWLQKRTRKRMARGVEGTHTI